MIYEENMFCQRYLRTDILYKYFYISIFSENIPERTDIRCLTYNYVYVNDYDLETN